MFLCQLYIYQMFSLGSFSTNNYIIKKKNILVTNGGTIPL
ncbi:hypothetical protein SAIL_20280 [Streptococcus agalactiae ILRI112]|nr:hypothetical protein SAIL_20280 [Streptococcus agalactiae ILRI112]